MRVFKTMPIIAMLLRKNDMLYKNPEQALVRVKSRALTFKGDCEYHLEHPDEAERYYLESTFSRNETIFSHRGTVVS